MASGRCAGPANLDGDGALTEGRPDAAPPRAARNSGIVERRPGRWRGGLSAWTRPPRHSASSCGARDRPRGWTCRQADAPPGERAQACGRAVRAASRMASPSRRPYSATSAQSRVQPRTGLMSPAAPCRKDAMAATAKSRGQRLAGRPGEVSRDEGLDLDRDRVAGRRWPGTISPFPGRAQRSTMTPGHRRGAPRRRRFRCARRLRPRPFTRASPASRRAGRRSSQGQADGLGQLRAPGVGPVTVARVSTAA